MRSLAAEAPAKAQQHLRDSRITIAYPVSLRMGGRTWRDDMPRKQGRGLPCDSPAVGLVTDVADDLGALGEGVRGVPGVGDGQALLRLVASELITLNGIANVLRPVTVDAKHWLRCTGGVVGEASMGLCSPRRSGRVDRVDLRLAERVKRRSSDEEQSSRHGDVPAACSAMPIQVTAVREGYDTGCANLCALTAQLTRQKRVQL